MSEETVKTPSSWRLFRDSVGAARRNWKVYTLIILIIVGPIQAIGAGYPANIQGLISAYGALAIIIMSVALIWFTYRTQKDSLSLSQAYYESSAAITRFIVVFFIMALMSLPAAFGLSLLVIGLTTLGGPGDLGPTLVVVLLSLLLIAPSVWLIIRNGLALIEVVITSARPLAALRAARKRTKKHFWFLLGRMVLLVLWLVLLGIVPAGILIALAVWTQQDGFLALMEVIISILLLPVFYQYVYRLYDGLSED